MTKDEEYDRMLAGKLYQTEKIQPEHREWRGKLLVQQINRLPADHIEEIIALEHQIFQGGSQNLYVQPPFEVDFGKHIRVGDNFYCNVNAIFLDTNWITIGDNVKIGPRVNLLTATHPVDPGIRTALLEYAEPITIGDNVWLGGNVTVLPGVHIGANSVIGAGSVVTKDVPADVVAVGDPAKVLRPITAADHAKWQQEVDAYRRAQHEAK